jgi:hypothetical protein
MAARRRAAPLAMGLPPVRVSNVGSDKRVTPVSAGVTNLHVIFNLRALAHVSDDKTVGGPYVHP